MTGFGQQIDNGGAIAATAALCLQRDGAEVMECEESQAERAAVASGARPF